MVSLFQTVGGDVLDMIHCPSLRQRIQQRMVFGSILGLLYKAAANSLRLLPPQGE